MDQLIDYAESVGRTEDEARGVFARFNVNGDAFICLQEKGTEKVPDKVNFIDNKVARP